jgi:hypothetical protein
MLDLVELCTHWYAGRSAWADVSTFVEILRAPRSSSPVLRRVASAQLPRRQSADTSVAQRRLRTRNHRDVK